MINQQGDEQREQVPDAEFEENMYITPIGQKRVYPKLTENTFWDK